MEERRSEAKRGKVRLILAADSFSKSRRSVGRE